jgi:hypothetical protein
MRTGRAALAHRDGRHGLQRKSLRFDFRDNFRSRDQPGRLPANNVQSTCTVSITVINLQ